MTLQSAEKKIIDFGTLHVWFLILCTVTFLHFSTSRVADADSFYHFCHAQVYAKQGMLSDDFSWTTFSIIRTSSGDMWYGFHLLLSLFTLIPDSLIGLKVASVFCTVFLLFSVAFTCKKHNLLCPGYWSFVLLFAAPSELFRCLMLRPHLLSMGLSVLLLSLLIRGRYWQVGICTLLMTSIHESLFWLPMVVVAVYLAINRLVVRSESGLKQGAFLLMAVLAGIVLGAWLRPDFLGAIYLVKVQTLDLARARQAAIPLDYARELSALPLPLLVTRFGPMLFCWLTCLPFAVFSLLKDGKTLQDQERLMLLSTLSLSVMFFGITTVASFRGCDFWVVFSILLIAVTVTVTFRRSAGRKQGAKGAGNTRRVTVLPILCGVTLLVMIAYCSSRTPILLRSAIDPDRLRGASLWLRDHSRSRSIVFHTQWSRFPELLFWNKNNRYLGGSDPIFMYTYNPRLYWVTKSLDIDGMSSFVSTTAPNERTAPQETYTVLARDFNASYIVVMKRETPNLLRYVKTETVQRSFCKISNLV